MILCSLALAASSCSAIYSHPLAVTPESKFAAEVSFFRKPRFEGSLIGIVVYLDGLPLIKLGNGTYGTVRLKPGLYRIRVGENREYAGYTSATRRMRFDTGKKYYIDLASGIEVKGEADRRGWRTGFRARIPTLISEDRAKSLMAILERIPN